MVELLFPAGNATDFVGTLSQIFLYTDTGNGGTLGIMIILSVFAAMFATAKGFTYEKSFTVASFVSCIVGIFMAILGWINYKVLAICIFGLIYSTYFLLKESSQGEA